MHTTRPAFYAVGALPTWMSDRYAFVAFITLSVIVFIGIALPAVWSRKPYRRKAAYAVLDRILQLFRTRKSLGALRREPPETQPWGVRCLIGHGPARGARSCEGTSRSAEGLCNDDTRVRSVAVARQEGSTHAERHLPDDQGPGSEIGLPELHPHHLRQHVLARLASQWGSEGDLMRLAGWET
jgi:hypothetical protein